MIQKLIEDYEKELAKSLYNEWYYEREYQNPVKMGKEEAKQSLESWKKHTKAVEEQIKSLQEYAQGLPGRN